MSHAKLARRLRRLPADALFSHRTAAWLHGLDMPACDPIQVTLPQSSMTSHLAGTWLMRSDFAGTEACEVRGLPVTSRVRTIADLGRGLPLVESVVVLDMALRGRIASVQDLCDWTRTHPRHRGLTRLARAMELADGRSESQMETRLRMLLVLSGLPRPAVQVSLLGASMVEAGYKILRFTAGDILHRPASVAGQVERALGPSGPSGHLPMNGEEKLGYSIGSPN